MPSVDLKSLDSQIAALPYRFRVALGVRSAYRVQPLLHLLRPSGRADYIRHVDELLATASRHAAGAPWALAATTDQFLSSRMSTIVQGIKEKNNPSLHACRAACRTYLCINDRVATAASRAGHIRAAIEASAHAALVTTEIVGFQEGTFQCALNDLQNLQERSRATTDPEASIDPSESGPLGAFWAPEVPAFMADARAFYAKMLATLGPVSR